MVNAEQMKKVATQDGFFAALDQSGGSTPKALKLYGIEESEYSGDAEMMDKVHEMRSRIIKNPKFDGSRTIGAILFEATMDREIETQASAKYLWEQKKVVPFLKIDKGLAEEKDGVQLMKDMPKLDELLDKAVAAGIFGTKERSVVKLPNPVGIQAVVDQQFEIGKKIIAKGLVPMLEPEVDINSPDKERCEELLLDALMQGLRKLTPDQKVMFKLTIPSRPNLYLPLMGHPNTVRVVALSGGYNRADSCKLLKANIGMIASFSRAFAEGMNAKQSDEEFTKTMDESCQAIYEASKAVSAKEEQMIKVSSQNGFFSALDQSGGSTPKALKLYGIEESEYSGDAEMMDKVHEMRSRIITNPMYHGGRVIGAILFEATMDREIGMVGSAKYLWEQKKVVPFLKIDKGLAEEKDGVQLMKDMPKLDELLDKAVTAGIFGTKERSVIKLPNEAGIRAIVDQQFEIGKKIIAKGLVPMLEPEVDINSPDKVGCEELLLDALMQGLRTLEPDQKVMFKLTIPTKPNQYLPLMAHPNTIRVVALSGGYNRTESCKLLKQNVGMIASFSRAFAEGLNAKQSDEEFTKTMDESCEEIYQASCMVSKKEEQMAKVSSQPGFFSALDQSGGSTPKALKLYGIDESEYSGDAEMMDKVHEMRSRIIKNPKYHGARVIGAILFEATMDREIGMVSSAKFLWEQKKVVPFLKIDKGLAEEKDGVQLMKDMPKLDELLDKAVKAGIFGTKERSVIKLANEAGIKAAAEQQFVIGKQILAKGLVPMLEPEVDINSPSKAECEKLLLAALLEGLKALTPEQKVMFKLTIPSEANLYKPLMEHPNTIRVVALSGGYNREESCKLLAANSGMIGSFSRAFAEGLSAKQSDEEFTKTIDESCEAIYQASRK